MNIMTGATIKIFYLAVMNSIHSRRWISYFANKGHVVHVMYFDETPLADLQDMSNITFHKVPSPPKKPGSVKVKYLSFLINMAREIPQIGRIIREVDPDLIHVHYIDYHAYLASIFGSPLMLTAWGSDILVHPKQNFVYRYIARTSLNRADMVTCDADHMKQAIQKFGVSADKVKVICFGTDMTKFNPSKKDSDIRKELGFSDDAKLVISLRTLRPIYDITTFIKTIPLVLEQAKEARFVIVGDGPEKNNLVQLSQELGVADAVRFTGRLSDENLQRYIASSDIYVSTSLSDGGLAASTAEAMASEIPVIITDFGNNAEWVEHGRGGLLFPLQDFRALSNHIVYCLRNPERAAQMARCGKDIISEKNNWEKEMEKVDLMYHEIARTKGRAR